MREKQILKLIDEFFPETAHLRKDDCIHLKEKDFLISTDCLVEEVHFLRQLESPQTIGYRAVAVNIGDIAAMGGIPKYLLMSACFPSNIEEFWLRGLMEGIKQACEEYKTSLVGGNLSSSEKVFLSGTVLGESFEGKIAYRDGAKPNHKIYLCGQLGCSEAGLNILKNRNDQEKQNFPNLIEAYCKPKAFVEESNRFIKTVQSESFSMMDISDGLIDCLEQMSYLSKVKFKIDISKLPINEELRNYVKDEDKLTQLLVSGGGDYALIGTGEFLQTPDDWTEIGEILAPSDETLIELNNGKINLEPNQFKGFEHF